MQVRTASGALRRWCHILYESLFHKQLLLSALSRSDRDEKIRRHQRPPCCYILQRIRREILCNIKLQTDCPRDRKLWSHMDGKMPEVSPKANRLTRTLQPWWHAGHVLDAYSIIGGGMSTYFDGFMGLSLLVQHGGDNGVDTRLKKGSHYRSMRLM